MSARSCFIMGLPAAGKTTYLAALWYCLSQPDKTALRLKKYSGDHSYLAQISETWLCAKKVSRTNIHTEEKALTLTLIDSMQNEFEVTFPDLSGESFQKQYIDREIGKDNAEYINKCEGILLFVNPSKVQEVCLISEIPIHLRNAHDEIAISSRDPLQSDPTDVQLVELLQFISFLRGNTRVRLGVVVSAWDTINGKQYDKPEKFIRERLPFVWQYLLSNHTIFDIFFYGVSAQGGALESEEDAEKLLVFDEQMDRIVVVDNDHNRSNDITLPLWMAVNKEGEELHDKN